jgi:hypothetical protein
MLWSLLPQVRGRLASVSATTPEFLTGLLQSTEAAIAAISEQITSDQGLTPMNRVRLVDLQSAYERVSEQLKSLIEAFDHLQ